MLKTLGSAKQLALSNDIDKLRSLGVSQYVNLPQLIVCGDQSSGKSSVLEAISGIPFPTKDNLCIPMPLPSAVEVVPSIAAEPLFQYSQQEFPVTLALPRVGFCHSATSVHLDKTGLQL